MSESFLLTFKVSVQSVGAAKGKMAISFLPENAERAGCEWQIELSELRAQFGPGSLDHFAPRQKSLREGGAPQQAGDYAIEKLIGLDGAFTVRIIVKTDDKIGGSLIDTEIAGQRTMISYRPDLIVKKLLFRTEELQLSGVKLGRLLRSD